MPPLSKGIVAFNGLLAPLAKLVEDEWRPPTLPTELKYRDDLLGFLRRNIPDDARRSLDQHTRGSERVR